MGFFQVLKIIFQSSQVLLQNYSTILSHYTLLCLPIPQIGLLFDFSFSSFLLPSNIQKYVHLQSFLHLMMWKRGNFSKLTLFLKIFHRIIFLFLINEFFFLSQIFSRFCWNVVVQIVTSLFSLPKNVQLQKFQAIYLL